MSRPFDELSPADVIAICDAPSNGLLVNPALGQNLFGADNRRIVLSLHWNGTGANVCQVSPFDNAAPGVGYVLNAQAPNLFFSLMDHGPIMTRAFNVTTGGTGTLSWNVTTVQDWPNVNPNELRNLKPPVLPRVINTITRKPGVGGRLGILDYWEKIKDVLSGRCGQPAQLPNGSGSSFTGNG